MYTKNFFNKQELSTLVRSVIDNYNPMELKNTINLKNMDALIQKLMYHFAAEYDVEVKLIQSFIFLASSSTMASRMTSPDQGWHTDGTCQVIDGDCFNVWIPIYNDSTCSGIEVMTEEGNKQLYQTLGDPTYPLMIYLRDAAPWVFDIMKKDIPAEADMLLVKSYNGTILPVTKNKMHVVRCDNARPGDIAIFKQSELHRGFHENGIRIQLSLKFQTVDARLNPKPSNNLYKLFEKFTGGQGGYDQFMSFSKLFSPKYPMSKHGMLEKDLLVTLLKNMHKDLVKEKLVPEAV
jgi:hypothetical protein